MPRHVETIAARVRAANPDIETLPLEERKIQIQLVLFDYPDADPDNASLLDAIDAAVMQPEPLLPRVKALTGLSDRALAELVGKSRPTVQAYISGRLDESLPPQAYAKLAIVVDNKAAEVSGLLSELRSAGAAAG